MSAQRKHYPPEFKAHNALEALKEQKTLNQLVSEYGVHPNQISQWKKADAKRVAPAIHQRGSARAGQRRR